MAARLVLLSGSIAVGKSTLGNALVARYGAGILRTRDLLAEASGPLGRTALQQAGQELDAQTRGEWVSQELTRRLPSVSEALLVVDCVRTRDQVTAIRSTFGRDVVHVHLTAEDVVLIQRFEDRRIRRPIGEPPEYQAARWSRSESEVVGLAEDADVVIGTDRSAPRSVLARAVARLGLRPGLRARCVDVLVGGQYGSEGKGNIAAHLAPEYGLLVRSGGPNAGHSVMTRTGKRVQHHLPSGTQVSEAELLLSAGAVVRPDELLAEIASARIDNRRLSIDPSATVILDEHRVEELSLRASIGSTGSGTGAATAGRITGRDGGVVLAKHVHDLQPYLRDGREVLDNAYSAGQRVFVEGTQGSGLSLFHGPYPYVTSRDTTTSGLLAESGIPPTRVERVVMVCRTYPIRVQDPDGVGATSGYMENEIDWLTVARRSGLRLGDLERQERTSTTGRRRRVAEFDWALLSRQSALNGPTDIALTFVDQIHAANVSARRFEQLSPETIRFAEEVEHVAGAPVSLVSTRFHQRSVLDRRHW